MTTNTTLDMPLEHANNIQELSARIKELLYSYSGRMCVAEVVGVLEIVKYDILQDHQV